MKRDVDKCDAEMEKNSWNLPLNVRGQKGDSGTLTRR